MTSREPSDVQGKLMPMESRKHVGTEAGTGEEAKMPGVAHTKASEKAAASYPIIIRSYELSPTSMSDCDASSRTKPSAGGRVSAEGLRLTRYALRVSVSAARTLGMGFGDRFGDFRGGSGSFKGRVQRADKPGEMQGKRASKRRSHIT